MVLVQNRLFFFLFFFFGAILLENVSYDILEPKKRLSMLYKQEVQKVEKLTFSHRIWSMVLVQNRQVFYLFF